MQASGDDNNILFNKVNKFSNKPTQIYYSIYHMPPPTELLIVKKWYFFTDTPIV